MKSYVVIYNRGQDGEENWGAYVPDLPGCISTGDTLEQVRANIKEAIEGHIAALIETGQPVPEPMSQADSIAIAA